MKMETPSKFLKTQLVFPWHSIVGLYYGGSDSRIRTLLSIRFDETDVSQYLPQHRLKAIERAVSAACRWCQYRIG